MAIKADDLYWRIYADDKLKIFTLTMVPLQGTSHHALVASETTLKAIAEGLVAVGWTQCQRRAFEVIVRRGSID